MKNIDITDNIPALFGAIETLKQQVAKKEGEAYIEGQGVITGLELAIGLLGLEKTANDMVNRQQSEVCC